jgi:hypothetical protein
MKKTKNNKLATKSNKKEFKGKLDGTIDLSNNCIIINGNTYILLKIEAPTHLNGYQPLANIIIKGDYTMPV